MTRRSLEIRIVVRVGFVLLLSGCGGSSAATELDSTTTSLAEDPRQLQPPYRQGARHPL